MFVETHAHLYSEYYDNIDEIIEKSKEKGIIFFINAGCDQKTNEEVLKLSKKYESMYCTLGIHPENVDNYTKDDLKFIEQNLKEEKVVAIGEIGLDYHYDNFNKDAQIELFEMQLELAQKYNFPVVVHSREATMDTLNTLKKYKLKGIIHAFSGSVEIAKEYIKLGYKLGVGGVVTFKNSNLKELVKEVGIENFVLETDSPYLSPEPLRGTQNYPGNISIIVDFLMDYLNISDEEIALLTNFNVAYIFDKLRIN